MDQHQMREEGFFTILERQSQLFLSILKYIPCTKTQWLFSFFFNYNYWKEKRKKWGNFAYSHVRLPFDLRSRKSNAFFFYYYYNNNNNNTSISI